MATITTSANVTKCAFSNTSVYNSVMKSAEGAQSHINSLDGTIEIVWKYWDTVKKSDGTIKRHGFNELVSELGIACKSFAEFKKYVKDTIEKGMGLHKLNKTIKTTKVKGESVEVECVGLWGTRNMENKSVAPTMDAKGKATYPYALNEESKPYKVSVCKPITKWDTNVLFAVLIQNTALKGGMVPYTEEMFYAEHPEFAPIADDAPIIEETAPSAPSAPSSEVAA